MKRFYVFTLAVLMCSSCLAQEDGSFGITVGGDVLFGLLADSNQHGFEFGVVSKVPVADKGLIHTMVTSLTYLRLPWNDEIEDPERSGHVFSTLVGFEVGDGEGLHVFGGPTLNFGLFEQGYVGADIGAGYGMRLGWIDRIADVSVRYSAFNAANKIMDWEDTDALDLVRFNLTLTI